MRNTIERKMIESTIHAFSVQIVEGSPSISELAPVTVYGKVNQVNAVKVVKKVYPDVENITVSKIETEEVRFEIDVDVFIAHARKIETKAKQEETKNN